MLSEVGLPMGGVAYHYIERLDFSGRRRALTSDSPDDRTDICGDGTCVFIIQADVGHSLCHTAALNNWDDQLPVLIGECYLGTQQIGAAHIAATKVAAMARLAADAVERLALSHNLRILRSTARA